MLAVRTSLVAVVVVLALSAPAAAQDPGLFEPSRGATAGGAADDGARSPVLVGLGGVLLLGAAGALVLALRTPRRMAAVVAPEPPHHEWHPRPVAGPPPLPAFGPGAGSAAPSGAPPPPTD